MHTVIVLVSAVIVPNEPCCWRPGLLSNPVPVVTSGRGGRELRRLTATTAAQSRWQSVSRWSRATFDWCIEQRIDVGCMLGADIIVCLPAAGFGPRRSTPFLPIPDSDWCEVSMRRSENFYRIVSLDGAKLSTVWTDFILNYNYSVIVGFFYSVFVFQLMYFCIFMFYQCACE